MSEKFEINSKSDEQSGDNSDDVTTGQKKDTKDKTDNSLKRTANEFSEDSNSVLDSQTSEAEVKKQKVRENGREDNEDESNDGNEAEAGNDLEDEEEDEEEDVVPEDYADDDDDEEAANDDDDDEDDDQ